MLDCLRPDAAATCDNSHRDRDHASPGKFEADKYLRRDRALAEQEMRITSLLEMPLQLKAAIELY